VQINEVQYNDNEIKIKQKPVDRRQGFHDSMKKLSANDNQSFVYLLGAAGYERAEDVPEESYGKVYKQIKEAMDKIKADF
jgi:nicotinamide riboside kinase